MSSEEERWHQAGELFQAARALPTDRQPAFLEARCPDPELRREVERLLRAHAALERTAEGGFLEGLDPERSARLLTSGELAPDAGDELGRGDALGRYRILRQLGEGGMGVVYLAEDPRLGRLTALKLLPRHLSVDAAARRRFEEEARAASALDHPNIATVYEIGEASDHRLYIAMAYYEGETLLQEIARGPLPIARAVAMAMRIADALATAHRNGIVHRDIKPANVVVTPDGVPKIVDFGIAKIAGSALTRTGATRGTVAYMSPEQMAGGAVAPRADVWSVGVMLYEMLSGQRPFRSDREQALIYSIRHDEPPPLQKLRPGVPTALENVVSRCLRKDASARYAHAGALLDALRALADSAEAGLRPDRPRPRPVRAAALALGLVMLAGALAVWPALPGGGDSPDAAVAWNPGDRLAVLPLANASPAAEDAFVAEAITDELTSALAGFPGLRVIARASVQPYRDSEKALDEIGRELGARVLLAGRVYRSAERIRLSVRLVNPATQDELWSQRHDLDLKELPGVQSEIAQGVAATLGLSPPRAEATRPTGHETDDAGAYSRYLRGRYFLEKWDEGSARTALGYFREALDLDPTYARAWSGMAGAYHVLARLTALPSDEAYPRMRAAAERAIELDESLPDAHGVLALAFSFYYWDAQAAEKHFRRAIELDPNGAAVRAMYAEHLRNRGRFDDALVEIRAAQEIDPISPAHRLEEGIILYLARRHEEAIRRFRRLLAADPAHRTANFFLAKVLIEEGRYDDAVAALRALDPDAASAPVRSLLGYIHAVSGRPHEARRMLRALQARSDASDATAYQSAVIHVGLGEADRAIELLWQTYRERGWPVRLLKVDPLFDPLRSDPRFLTLLRETGFDRAAR